jgi:hypothetical protein
MQLRRSLVRPFADSWRAALVVSALTIIAFIIRWKVGANHGLWADEAAFMEVVKLRPASEMFAFLQFHESHPPLFYLMMRGWMALTGDADNTLILVPVVMSSLLVPVVFATTSSLFSTRPALLAAVLTTLASPLVEHSAQLRPYGLMMLLVLVSTYALVVAVSRLRIRYWIAYAVATIALLYTHNWAWLVLAGQLLALVAVVLWMPVNRRRILTGWLFSASIVMLTYLPWISTLRYQVVHAGHSPVTIDDASTAFGFVVFSLFRITEMFLVGHTVLPKTISFLGATFGLAAAMLAWRRRPRVKDAGAQRPDSSTTAPHAGIILLTVPLVSLFLALALSGRSNLLIDRCVVTVLPLLIILFADWSVRALRSPGSRLRAALASAVLAMVPVFWANDLIKLEQVPRTNAPQAGAVIKSRARETDLLIVIPQWYAPSFNRYFSASLQQIDFPYQGRVGAVSFSDVWKRASDTNPVRWLEKQIYAARADNRRVWLVVSDDYLKAVTVADSLRAYRYREPSIMDMLRAQRIRQVLTTGYGPPDSTVNRGPTQYENLRVYLFAPDNGSL